jgi:hypothetical protein
LIDLDEEVTGARGRRRGREGRGERGREGREDGGVAERRKRI